MVILKQVAWCSFQKKHHLVQRIAYSIFAYLAVQSFASYRIKIVQLERALREEKRTNITIVWLGTFDSQKRLFPLSVPFAGDSVAKTVVYTIDGNTGMYVYSLTWWMRIRMVRGWQRMSGAVQFKQFHLNILIIHFTCRAEAAYRVNSRAITEYVEHDFASITIRRLHLCVMK